MRRSIVRCVRSTRKRADAVRGLVTAASAQALAVAALSPSGPASTPKSPSTRPAGVGVVGCGRCQLGGGSAAQQRTGTGGATVLFG